MSTDDPEITQILRKLPPRLRPVGLPDIGRESRSEAVKGSPPISPAAVRRLAQAGFAAGEIAAHFGIGRRKFFYLMREHPGLADDFKIGRARFTKKVQDRIKKMAFTMQDRTCLLKIARQLGIDGRDRDWPKS